METVTRTDNKIGSLKIGTTNYHWSYKFDLRPYHRIARWSQDCMRHTLPEIMGPHVTSCYIGQN